MRAALVFGLLLLNLGIRWSSRELLREQEELETRVARMTSEAERRRRETQQSEALASVLEGLERLNESSPSLPDGPLDVTSLRELLLEAESGLSLERLSLDFRPLATGGAGVSGSRIGLSSRGDFHALATYLGRIERAAAPLLPEELRLRRDASGRTVLDARWTSVWESPGAITSGELSELEAWLASDRGLEVADDLFARRPAAPPPPPPSPSAAAETETDLRPSDVSGPETRAADPAAPPPHAVVPALAGFVLARPELEPDVGRRVLAALRFDGELHLIQVGESLGGYELAELEPRESVTLVNGATGERVRLQLR